MQAQGAQGAKGAQAQGGQGQAARGQETQEQAHKLHIANTPCPAGNNKSTLRDAVKNVLADFAR